MMDCENFRRYVDMVPESLRYGPDLDVVHLHADRCKECSEYLAVDREFEYLLEESPVIHPEKAFVCDVMDRVRLSVAGTENSADDTSQASFPYLLLSTTAVGTVLIVRGYFLGLVDYGLNMTLQRLAVNIHPAISGSLNALSDWSPATISEVVGTAILFIGLLFSDSAKLPLKAPR